MSEIETNKIIQGDCIEVMKDMPDESVDMVMTSPPYYGLRDYDEEEQIGLEETFEEYLNRLLRVTEQCQRVLKPKGTLWWVHGDSYCSGNRASGGGDVEQKDPKYKNANNPDYVHTEVGWITQTSHY